MERMQGKNINKMDSCQAVGKGRWMDWLIGG